MQSVTCEHCGADYDADRFVHFCLGVNGHSIEGEGREAPECNCYFSGDQADASDCQLHGGNR